MFFFLFVIVVVLSFSIKQRSLELFIFLIVFFRANFSTFLFTQRPLELKHLKNVNKN